MESISEPCKGLLGFQKGFQNKTTYATAQQKPSKTVRKRAPYIILGETE